MPITLSEREKVLLIALGATLLLLLGVWGLRGLAGVQRDLAEQLDSERETLSQLQTLDAQADRSGGPRQAGRSLAATMEDLLSRTGMRDRIQLNPVTQTGKTQAMEVKAEQLTLDEMVRLVYSIDNPDVPVQVDQLEVGPSFRDKELLRVSLRVVGQG
jgi:hypothetical protein